MKKLILIAALLAGLSAAYAEAPAAATGKQYMELCSNNVNTPACGNLLLSAIQRADNTKVANKKIVCVPKTVGYPEQLRVVKNFLQGSPGYLNMDLNILALGALEAAFPCQG